MTRTKKSTHFGSKKNRKALRNRAFVEGALFVRHLFQAGQGILPDSVSQAIRL